MRCEGWAQSRLVVQQLVCLVPADVGGHPLEKVRHLCVQPGLLLGQTTETVGRDAHQFARRVCQRSAYVTLQGDVCRTSALEISTISFHVVFSALLILNLSCYFHF